ncbi:hypothetical protein ACERIT_02015 [Halopenitus sp. H-Gu1]
MKTATAPLRSQASGAPPSRRTHAFRIVGFVDKESEDPSRIEYVVLFQGK